MAEALYILFEHAVGYGVFHVKEYDEMALLEPRVEKSVLDLGKFNSIIQLVHFAPFKSTDHAQENMKCIAEGGLHEDLKVILEESVPKSSKKLQILLGVGDAKLAGTIQEEMQIKCFTTGAVPEILRGLRLHFSTMVRVGRLNQEAASKAQLSLGHTYSRDKVQFNVNRVDNMIIQSIALLDQMDKDINTFSMRIREWYSYHFPELVKVVPENYMYAKVVLLIQDRKQISEDKKAQLEEILMDSSKAQAVLDAARCSMGMDIAEFDLKNIQSLCERVIGMAEYRKELSEYLIDRMKAVAPNLASLIGDQVGARLIAHAGSLTNLAKCPASTVQILGAEKALFRALKTRGNTPKYGLIFHSTFIGRAGAKNKGRISRYLANKCSIASRIDCFAETPSCVFGEHLKQQVEDRLKFLETGDAPAKNIDVMQQAITEFNELQAKEAKKKKKEKKKQRKSEENGESLQAETSMEVDEEETSKKKKKKKKRSASEAESGVTDTMESAEGEGESPEKKKKKKKERRDSETAGDSTAGEETPAKKEKKKKRKSRGDD